MGNITELEAIESLGHLLAYYESDLKYITSFHLFRSNKKDTEDYLTEKNGGFQKFINEYKVARNIRKDSKQKLLEVIRDFEFRGDEKAVDDFADKMKRQELTQKDKVMTVLASKIFFLNRPDKIIPMDSLNKKALDLKENKYRSFIPKANEFIENNKEEIVKYLEGIQGYLVKIEDNLNFKMDFDLEKYRINRFSDNYLRVKGSKLKRG
jgi:hypothetical protein